MKPGVGNCFWLPEGVPPKNNLISFPPFFVIFATFVEGAIINVEARVFGVVMILAMLQLLLDGWLIRLSFSKRLLHSIFTLTNAFYLQTILIHTYKQMPVSYSFCNIKGQDGNMLQPKVGFVDEGKVCYLQKMVI